MYVCLSVCFQFRICVCVCYWAVFGSSNVFPLILDCFVTEYVMLSDAYTHVHAGALCAWFTGEDRAIIEVAQTKV